MSRYLKCIECGATSEETSDGWVVKVLKGSGFTACYCPKCKSMIDHIESGSLEYALPPGHMVIISTGKWSDYIVLGLFHTLIEIDINKLRKEWFNEHSDNNEYKFLASMLHRGFIEEVDYHELLLESCDRDLRIRESADYRIVASNLGKDISK